MRSAIMIFLSLYILIALLGQGSFGKLNNILNKSLDIARQFGET